MLHSSAVMRSHPTERSDWTPTEKGLFSSALRRSRLKGAAESLPACKQWNRHFILVGFYFILFFQHPLGRGTPYGADRHRHGTGGASRNVWRAKRLIVERG